MKRIRYWLKTRWRARLLRRAFSMESKGRHEAAIRLHDRIGVVGRAGDRASTIIDVESLVRKAWLLSSIGEFERSTQAATTLIGLLTGINDPYCRDRLAWAQLFLATDLTNAGRFVEGMNEYDGLVAQFRFDDDAGIELYVAEGLVRKGHALLEDGSNNDYALRCFNEVLKRCHPASDPEIQKRVAEARFYKALCLERSGDLASALSQYLEIADAYELEIPSLRNVAGRALFQWAVAGDGERSEEESLRAFSDVIARFGDHQDFEIRSIIGQAYGRLGAIHLSTDRWEAAIEAFEASTARLRSMTSEFDQEALRWALYLQGDTLALAGRLDEAVERFEEVVERYENANVVAGRHLVASALLRMGAIWGSLGNVYNELAAYEKIRTDFTNIEEFEHRYVLPYAIVNSIVALRRMNRTDEAEQLDRDLLKMYGTSTDPEIQAALELADHNRNCVALDDLERFEIETSTREVVVAGE